MKVNFDCDGAGNDGPSPLPSPGRRGSKVVGLFSGKAFAQGGTGQGGVDAAAIGFEERAGGLADLFFGESVGSQELLDELVGLFGGGAFGEVFLGDADFEAQLGDLVGAAELL